LTNTAPILRLDDYFRDKPAKPDLMKVDVDGAEMGVLRGAATLLAQDDLQMLLEVHPHYLPRFHSSTAEVFAYLRDRGFRCFQIIDFRKTDRISLEDITERPEVLNSPTGDLLFVSRKPPSSIHES
jgi:Methyltransferase FkbM domain